MKNKSNINIGKGFIAATFSRMKKALSMFAPDIFQSTVFALTGNITVTPIQALIFLLSQSLNLYTLIRLGIY